MLQPDALAKDVEIKGSLFPLSILQLDTTDLSVLATQLEFKRQQAKDFFYRAPLVINIEKTQGAALDFGQLKAVVETLHFVCVGVCNTTSEQASAAMDAGLAILKQPRAKTAPKSSVKQESEKAESVAASNEGKKPVSTAQQTTPEQVLPQLKSAKVVRQNVRSGQQIYAKDSDLIIMGSVSNGAEVIADGSIHIYGNLRGRALAGASGAASGVIYCQSMEAELVSIAGNYWVSEQIPKETWRQPTLFNFDSNKLSAQPVGFNGK